MAFPRELFKMELYEREADCLLRFLLFVCCMGSGRFPKELFIWKVEGGMTVERRSFPESAFSLSSSGDYRQHQHPLASFIRVCVSCPLVPALTERLQGRAGHTGAGVCEHWQGGDVGPEQELLAGTAPGSRDEQARRELLMETLLQGRYGHLLAMSCSADAFPEQPSSPLVSYTA